MAEEMLFRTSQVSKGNEKSKKGHVSMNGTIRKIDALGRIVIPIQIRRALQLDEGVPVEIEFDGATIQIRKYSSREDAAELMNRAEQYISNDPSLLGNLSATLKIKFNEIKNILDQVM